MSFYQQNLEIVKERFGELASRIEAANIEEKAEVVATSRGVPTILYKTEAGKKLFIHSSFDPLKEAYQLVQSKKLEDVQVVFVLGLGLAYHLEYLYKNPDFTGTIYVIEPSLEIFKVALENRDLRSILSDRKVQFFISPDVTTVKESIYTYVYNHILKCEFIYLPAYQNIFNIYYHEVLDAINAKATRRFCDYNTVEELSEDWERNSLENIPRIVKSVSFLSLLDKFKNIPGIIVAAGPSLDKNVHLLKPLLPKSVVICMGTSLRPLVRSGIKPHFVTVVDASEAVLKQFEGVSDSDLEGIWLLSEISVSPKVIKKFYPRVIFYYAMGNPFIRRIFDEKTYESMYLESGGSVANSALGAALKFGFNPVVFVAQDFCLEDNRSHASGTMYENDRYTDCKGVNFVTLPGNYEKEVISFRNFYTFLRWTETCISKHPDTEFINATCGGAKIAGANLSTLEELDARFSEIENSAKPKVILENLLRTVPPRFDKAILGRIKGALRDLKKMDRFIEQGQNLCKARAGLIKKVNKLDGKEEKELASKSVEFFIKLGKFNSAVELVDLRIKNDLAFMHGLIETNKIKAKGYTRVMEHMPEVFRKFKESSRLVKSGLKNAIKEEGLIYRLLGSLKKRRG